MSDKNTPNIPKEQFNFVQQDSKIFDKEFETKPIGYFQDAMIRFVRNKTNVVATSILLVIVLMSIFQPILTSKNYVNLEPAVAFLPPRVPILENFGIADGLASFQDQPVILNTINESTGFGGNPIGYNPEFILEESREYYTIGCSDFNTLCQGGEAVLRLDSSNPAVTVGTTQILSFDAAQQTVLSIDVVDLDEDSAKVLEVFVRPNAEEPFVLLTTIIQPGQYDIDVFDALGLSSVDSFSSSVRLRFVSDDRFDFVSIASIALTQGGSSEPSLLLEGQPLVSNLRSLNLPGEGGSIVRQNASIQMMSFEYDSYSAVFGLRPNNALPISQYNEIIAANPACVRTENPANPNGWLMGEGCPIVEVIRENPGVVVGGINYGSYVAVIDYALLNGYDSIPYFLFGTTNAGRDLFSLIWVATRTSLLIGLIVAGINISIGVLFGSISGYYGGNIDIIMQRFSEIVGRIPFLVILAIFIALLGAGIQTLIFILIVSGWIGVAYVTRTQFYRFKGREYVLASRTLGAKDMRLIFRHILPNGIGTIITASILLIPATIFAESTISYLGFGIGHGTSFNFLGMEFSGVSVGVLLADGRQELITRPYLTVYPAIVISILMITFNMFGNALRDALNPALRGSL
jgi:ABC-type dipeptide/oligopeptide/nickel transport system permease subunit